MWHRTVRAVLLASLSTVIASASWAIPVTITYGINPGGYNDTGLLGGATVTGGTAVVRWQMTPLQGHFLYVSKATLLSVSLTAPGTTINFAGSLTGYVGGSAAPLWQLLAITRISSPWTAPATHTDHRRDQLELIHDGSAPASQRLSLVLSRGVGCGLYCTAWASLGVSGQEISRVPEPASASLVLLGLVGLAGVGGARRFMRHR